MLLYYRGSDALVTEDTFEVRWPRPQRFPVRELRGVRVVRHALDRTVVASMHTALGAFVFVAFSWPVLDSVEAWFLALMLVATPAAVSGVCLRVRPRAHELRAHYGDRDVSLYTSDDPRVFGQVQRALVRARERA